MIGQVQQPPRHVPILPARLDGAEGVYREQPEPEGGPRGPLQVLLQLLRARRLPPAVVRVLVGVPVHLGPGPDVVFLLQPLPRALAVVDPRAEWLGSHHVAVFRPMMLTATIITITTSITAVAGSTATTTSAWKGRGTPPLQGPPPGLNHLTRVRLADVDAAQVGGDLGPRVAGDDVEGGRRRRHDGHGPVEEGLGDLVTAEIVVVLPARGHGAEEVDGAQLAERVADRGGRLEVLWRRRGGGVVVLPQGEAVAARQAVQVDDEVEQADAGAVVAGAEVAQERGRVAGLVGLDVQEVALGVEVEEARARAAEAVQVAREPAGEVDAVVRQRRGPRLAADPQQPAVHVAALRHDAVPPPLARVRRALSLPREHLVHEPVAQQPHPDDAPRLLLQRQSPHLQADL